MFHVRKLWLAPTIIFTIIVYYLLKHIWVREIYHYGQHMSSLHLRPEKYKTQYPIESLAQLPSGTAKSIPRIQHDFSKSPETAGAEETRLERRDAVKESFAHAWNGYRAHAWARDEVAPVSGRWRNSFGGWGATLVDTMDTLWIMGLKAEFEDCVKVVAGIDFTTNTEDQLNVFETTIRYLGGLLAAYDISNAKYPVLLKKAKELGEVLYLAFDTPNHMPVARWKWANTALGRGVMVASTNTLLAELGSLSLEFTRLSQLTGEPRYFDAVHRIATIMAAKQKSTRLPGLWPTIVDAKELKFDVNHFTLGGMADSAYEYLPKQYMLLGGLDDTYQTMYTSFIDTAKKTLFFKPMTLQNDDILFSGNGLVAGKTASDIVSEPQAQHLACFLGGMVATGARIFSRPNDLHTARKLVDGCIWSYRSMPSGLMPELFSILPCYFGSSDAVNCSWSDEAYYTAVAKLRASTSDLTGGMSDLEAGKWWVKQKSLLPPYTDLKDARYILRPEAIESIFILYRITGDASLLDSAWTMFVAIENATRTDIAHAAVSDVRSERPPRSDRMESFWLAETLKYFYLLFSKPELVSLDDYVLNTEAHPFKRPKAGERLGL